MSSWLLLNNILSIGLIFVCWWLVHLNATRSEPYGRIIAVGYSTLALLVLANGLFRNFEPFRPYLPWSLLASKAGLVFTLTMVAVRLEKMFAVRRRS